MKTKAIIGAVGLLVGVAVGGISGAWVERRSSGAHLAVAQSLEQIYLDLFSMIQSPSQREMEVAHGSSG